MFVGFLYNSSVLVLERVDDVTGLVWFFFTADVAQFDLLDFFSDDLDSVGR